MRDLEKLAQNLYISPPTVSQRAALACFEPDDARAARGAAASVSRAPRFPRAGAAVAGFRHSGDADRRLLRLCRQLALRCGFAAFLRRRARRRGRRDSRRASTSGRTAPRRTSASRTRSRWPSSRTEWDASRGSSRSGPSPRLHEREGPLPSANCPGARQRGGWSDDRATSPRRAALRDRRFARRRRLLGDRVLLAGARRAARSALARTADPRGRRIHDRSDAQDEARARAGDAGVREPRARAAGQRAATRATPTSGDPMSSGTSSRRPSSRCRRASGAFRSRAASPIAATSPRRMRAPRQRALPPRATTCTSAACRPIRRSATSTTRCSRRSSAIARLGAGPAHLPRARASGRLREGRHVVQRVVRRRGRGGRARALAGSAGARPAAAQFAADVARMHRLRADFRTLIRRRARATRGALCQRSARRREACAQGSDLRRHARGVRADQSRLGRRARVRPLVRERREQRRHRRGRPLCRPRADSSRRCSRPKAAICPGSTRGCRSSRRCRRPSGNGALAARRPGGRPRTATAPAH